MRRLAVALLGAAILIAGAATKAATPAGEQESQAAHLAATLAAICPVAAYENEAAFDECARALRKIRLPFAAELAWGGDQPEKPIKKKGLTHFNAQVFQTMYLPLYSFTGHWSLTEDPISGTPIIRLEAYFRNRLPAGDYPYPFWHSADKWSAYETSNEIRLYLDPHGLAVIVTRGAGGGEANRGPYAHATTPAFDGAWQWRDPDGEQEPRVALFASRYSPGNPYLPDVDKAYRAFALRMRDESCLTCHTPSNKGAAERLVLLQTPRHAAGEIDRVIDAVKSGKMPEDDIGLRKDIPPERRAAILNDATAFRNEIGLADQWETSPAEAAETESDATHGANRPQRRFIAD